MNKCITIQNEKYTDILYIGGILIYVPLTEMLNSVIYYIH